MFSAFARTHVRTCISFPTRYLSNAASGDVRSQLTAELKNAMKTKDTRASTTIRSVLSEVYAADKVSPESKVGSSAIVLLLRKAVARRTESAAQFNQASRPDLAEKEEQEINLLTKFLPPLMAPGEIDDILKDVLGTEGLVNVGSDPRKATGKIYKAFFARVDRSLVDQDVLKRRIDAAFAS
ncbi:GatB/YqeY domain-containing protein [Peniophora sp. CONT]|nr:GatB/YqeY domain-containing protein [Peniophora sp. CONT]